MTRIPNENGTLNAYNIQPNEIQVDDRYGYKIIACIGDKNTWCAFRGLTDWSDERVAANGEEIPLSIAQYLFPTLYFNIPNYDNP